MDGERLAAFLASSGIQQRQNLILTLVEQHNWCMRAAKIQVAERYAEKLREAQQAAKERAEAEAAVEADEGEREVESKLTKVQARVRGRQARMQSGTERRRSSIGPLGGRRPSVAGAPSTEVADSTSQFLENIRGDEEAGAKEVVSASSKRRQILADQTKARAAALAKAMDSPGPAKIAPTDVPSKPKRRNSGLMPSTARLPPSMRPGRSSGADRLPDGNDGPPTRRKWSISGSGMAAGDPPKAGPGPSQVHI